MDRQALLLSTKGISLSAIYRYATTHGWKSVSGSKRRIWLFSHPDHSLVQLQIPMDTDEDTPLAILEVAMRVAEVENRSIDSVIADQRWLPAAALLLEKVIDCPLLYGTDQR